jgi:quercetin dioxygenase-like cupin family protein
MNKINLSQVKSREVIPGFEAKFIQSENVTLAYWTVKAGSALPNHSHPNEQVTNMLKGKFKMTVEGITKVITKGCVVIIPPKVNHSGIAITDCYIMDVFYPFRSDYQSDNQG